jgi:sulfite reductase (NADPH) flavoprotein alpha-component
MSVGVDPLRLWLAGALSLTYLSVCAGVFLRARRKRRALSQPDGDAARTWIVAYASQTGNAEELAGHTAATLRLAGIALRLCQLDELGAADLQGAERILFVTSTYGEGDAPDNAAAFSGRLMGSTLALGQLHYAVLALGDSSYAQFCGFGRALDRWLGAQGASALFPCIEVDRSATEAIERWHRQLSHLAGTSDAPDWSGPAYADWILAERRLMNPGSAGEPLYHLELEAPAGLVPQWLSGDLAQIAAPEQPSRPRDYSIASIPADGRVHLLVRVQRRADGGDGLASGWLTQRAAIGQTIAMRLRQHRRFRLEDNAGRPLILIGNGSGFAGLRGHLKSRVAAGSTRNWLMFGERHAEHDYHYRDELARWQAGGFLPRLDMVFSRDEPELPYVQDRLLAHADEVKRWLAEGAALYVCGSLEGMAGGVDEALVAMIGRVALDALAAAGRYRRDVY